MLSYHLGWEDRNGDPEPSGHSDRIYGSTCLASALAITGDSDALLPAAVAVEMVNSFTEIHDDIQGGKQIRRYRDAVWAVWGPAQAINAGDGLHALARLALLGLMERGVSAENTFLATQLLDRASLRLCEGRFDDLEAQEQIHVSVKRYFEMAAAKSGALLGCAMQLGAITEWADKKDALSALFQCGSKMGVALQVNNDLKEFWGVSSDPSTSAIEVLNKKKLLPIVYAIENADVHNKRKLGDIYFKRVLGREDVEEVRKLIEPLGAREFCEETVRLYRDEAFTSLDEIGLIEAPLNSLKSFMTSLFEVN
jgi:geranylgeranyl diphosphate synthase type I